MILRMARAFKNINPLVSSYLKERCEVSKNLYEASPRKQVVAASGLIACITYCLSAGGITAKVVPTSQPKSDWPVYGGQVADDHYSSLSQINSSNVKRLVVAWKFDSGEAGGMETNPLIVGRVLYAYTPSQKLIALDAATGKLLWKFDSGIKSNQPARGATYWTDGKDSRLFVGIMNFLYALDPITGRPIQTFGENGRIDLRKDLRGDYEAQSIALTSPGIIYKDLIILGGRNPEAPPAPPGDIRAFDVHTGALRWRFRTIPHPGELGYDTWPSDAWKTAGAANNWAGMALDLKRAIVYVPTGSAVFDFYGGNRVGNDLFADTLLALNAKTGKLLWYFQGVHHDIWDRDFPSPPSLVTIKRNGRDVDAVAQTTKQGYLYLFDRVTGVPLFPIVERPYPASDVPGEVSAVTQPRPLVPNPFARQLLTNEMLTTRTPEAHAWALQQFRAFRSGGQFVPLSIDKQTVVFPGFDGGAEWGGSAVDIKTGVIYVNSNDVAWTASLGENKRSAGPGLTIYQSQCAQCHGDTREGSPPSIPSLLDTERRWTSAQIADVIHEGKGRMPAFPGLQGDEFDALVAYLHTGKDVAATAAAAVENNARRVPSEPSEDSEKLGGSGFTAGDQVYASKCAICHGDDRKGVPPASPSLIGVSDRLDVAQILDRILNGKGAMPPFPTIKGQNLDALLHYLGVSQTADHPEQSRTEMRPAAAGTASGVEMRYRVTGFHKFLDPDGYPAVAPPWGTLNAIDLNTGKYVWKIPLGEYPELAARGITNTGSENYGGPIVTAGGLVFIGATIYDKKIRAFDSRSGKLLWQAELPFAGVATPATYMVARKQYVVIAAGGGRDGKPSGGAYIAFALP